MSRASYQPRPSHSRNLRIRLRRRGGGVGAEVPIPTYEALRNNERSGARMPEILLSGVSTRNYAKVLW
jgi:putative transposase